MAIRWVYDGEALYGLDIGMDGAGAEVFLAQIIGQALTQWCHKKKKV